MMVCYGTFWSGQYGHLIIADSLLRPWGKKALIFSLNTDTFYGPLGVRINGVGLKISKVDAFVWSFFNM